VIKPFSRPPVLSKIFATILILAFAGAPVDAARGIGWMIRGKKLRGWNILNVAATQAPGYYIGWVMSAEPAIISDYLAEDTDAPALRILCIILSDAGDSASKLKRSISSLRSAFGPAAILTSNLRFISRDNVLISNTRDIKDAIVQSGAEWILLLKAGDEVSPLLGKILSRARRIQSHTEIIYWDEDQLGRSGRCNPWVKPDWDSLLHASHDMLSGTCIIATSLASTISDAPMLPLDYSQFILQCIEASKIMPLHIPLILTHKRTIPGLSLTPVIKDDPDHWPKVSFLIPTRDQAHLLETCLDGLAQLEYPGETEWIIVDNGSVQPEALRLLETWSSDPRVRVLRDQRPFNFSALNNLAAQTASGTFLCLYNNDVETLDAHWLTEMVRHALQPSTGAVGAMLLYPDRTVQHAGVSIGVGGAAGHIMRGVNEHDDQNASWFRTTREVSAVTAACLLVAREKYFAVGGLDEAAFAVAFNDVDFCLKLKQAGWRNIYCAEARLIHHESKSRGSDMEAANFARYLGELAQLQSRWKTEGYYDPHYSPLFSRTSERCVLVN
jgi:O-antigen biosynthesis protein